LIPGEDAKLQDVTPFAFDYFSTDHLGTVRFSYKVDASGTLIASSTHDYEPFGLEIGAVETSDNTHRFTGHERDAETGNDYMHYRFYGASMGRFAKPDSNFDGAASNPQGWNLYSYVHGNPINLNDPTGHMYSIAGRNPHQLNHGIMVDGIETWYSGFSGVYDPNDPGRIAATERNQRAGTQVTAGSGGTVTTSAYDANGNLLAAISVSATMICQAHVEMSELQPTASPCDGDSDCLLERLTYIQLTYSQIERDISMNPRLRNTPMGKAFEGFRIGYQDRPLPSLSDAGETEFLGNSWMGSNLNYNAFNLAAPIRMPNAGGGVVFRVFTSLQSKVRYVLIHEFTHYFYGPSTARGFGEAFILRKGYEFYKALYGEVQ
jgi:RHS repeat-associated protein